MSAQSFAPDDQPGKRQSRPLNISAAGQSKKNTMTVWDRRTGRTYLVDCGADVSVFPATPVEKRTRIPTTSLVAANGSKIASWGTKKIDLQLGRRRTFTQEFQVANVTQPILGADFFVANQLAIDLAGKRLIDMSDFTSIPTKIACTPCAVAGLRSPHSSQYDTLLDEFRLTDPNKHGIEHHIVTEGPPLHARARRLDGEKLTAAKAAFSTMEELGIIRRSASPWASPLHIVSKPNGGCRPCGDFRRLNTVTKDDR